MFYLTLNDRERDRKRKDNSFNENETRDRIIVKNIGEPYVFLEILNRVETLYKTLPIVERILLKI